jgi:hypothetical protein
MNVIVKNKESGCSVDSGTCGGCNADSAHFTHNKIPFAPTRLCSWF